ncbi:MAG TPA: metallophosphoesterase, partial [Acidilobales archaeon]|nr:metallophosphoesterase [Acidilobales archaeon]
MAKYVKYYAKYVKYPTLSVPEPVLVGGTLEVRVELPPDEELKDFSMSIYNEFYSYDLEFINVSYSEYWKSWIAYFKLPNDVKPGFYSFKLTFTGAKSYEIDMPNSIWVLEEWPDELVFIFVGDTKTPAGEPYWAEMVKEANLIHPDFLIFDGDQVDRPYRSAWEKYLKWWLALKIPGYGVIGNHEYDAPGVHKTWSKIMGYTNYSVTIGKFLLIALDTGMDGWISMDQAKWLENLLKKNANKVKILVMHHPIFGYKIKDEKIEVVEVKDIDSDFERLFNEGYFYGSWSEHKEELKELFRIILTYGVRLVLSAHTHTDINNVVIYNGTEYYFITMSGVPYDVRDFDVRGFRLIHIYANGTIVRESLTYMGKAFSDYPNSIPIESGEKVYPYRLGYLEYYYTPANDGTKYAISFKAWNDLDMNFSEIYVCFKLPKDKPIKEYKFLPTTPEYEVLETDNYYYVILKDVDLPAHSVVKFTITAIDDTDDPTIGSITMSLGEHGWWVGQILVSDQGWGVDNVTIYYSLNGEEWKEPALYDFVKALDNGTLIYKFWISGKEITDKAYFKVVVTDFAMHKVVKEYVFTPEKGFEVPVTTTPTTPTTPP